MLHRRPTSGWQNLLASVRIRLVFPDPQLCLSDIPLYPDLRLFQLSTSRINIGTPPSKNLHYPTFSAIFNSARSGYHTSFESHIAQDSKVVLPLAVARGPWILPIDRLPRRLSAFWIYHSSYNGSSLAMLFSHSLHFADQQKQSTMVPLSYSRARTYFEFQAKSTRKRYQSSTKSTTSILNSFRKISTMTPSMNNTSRCSFADLYI